MLNLHNEIVNNLKCIHYAFGDSSFKEGRECFKYLYDRVLFRFREGSTFEKSFNTVFLENRDNGLAQYFRNIIGIFEFIHSTKFIGSVDKKFYYNLIISQLGDHEVAFLMYYSIIDCRGYPKLKFIIDEYDLFNDTDEYFLMEESHWDNFKEKSVSENPFVKSNS